MEPTPVPHQFHLHTFCKKSDSETIWGNLSLALNGKIPQVTFFGSAFDRIVLNFTDNDIYVLAMQNSKIHVVTKNFIVEIDIEYDQ